MEKFDTVGQDLVNHCVNDIGVCGAKPLYFMDYFATGKLAPSVAEEVITGFVTACKENGCSLIGGETAEMPGFYEPGEFDIAGTIVGVVERRKIVDGRSIKKGDLLIGLPSNGLHTNGYSLARHVLLRKFPVRKYISELGMSLGDELLKVHRSYCASITALTKHGLVRGMSHITGGGIIGNTMRVIPKGLSLDIDWRAWERSPIFHLVQKTGHVPEADMRRTFNLGIGLIVIVAPKDGERVQKILKKLGEKSVLIGSVV
jgi:phosphoribosylformylglycinamidine cyclo-ligase